MSRAVTAESKSTFSHKSTVNEFLDKILITEITDKHHDDKK